MNIWVSGIQHMASRIWYDGITNQDGLREEFNEDCSTPIEDLPDRSHRSKEDILFTYNITDIDAISDILGIL